MKNAYLALAIAAFLKFGADTSGHAQSPSYEPEKAAAKYPAYVGKVVKIGASPTQPPYAFSDPAYPNCMSGLEVKMIEGAMNSAGLSFEYMKGVWAGLLQSLARARWTLWSET